MNKNLFTIGEMVAACRTTKDTLYFYEKKGLIKPAFVDKNGYRYYDLKNFYRMDMISILREAGSSVKEILHFMENVNPKFYIQYMQQKQEYFQRKRLEYQLLEEQLQRSLEVTEQFFQMTDFSPKLESQEREYLILQKCSNYHNDRETIEAFSNIRSLCKTHNIPHDIHQSAMISKDRLLSRGDNRFENDYLYATAYAPISGNYVHIKPEGLYAVIIHKGAYTEISRTYDQLLTYINDHAFIINGNSYEKTIIGWFNSSKIDEYITKISIKIGDK